MQNKTKKKKKMKILPLNSAMSEAYIITYNEKTKTRTNSHHVKNKR
jgi:hypothetical protein